MKIEEVDRTLIVTREPGAKRVKNEANFWYELQRLLNSKGTQPRLRWYRIRPHKFAMTSMPFALRQGPNRKKNEAIIDNNHMIYDAAERFNAGEQVVLARFVLEDA
jgi:hypothetical protein